MKSLMKTILGTCIVTVGVSAFSVSTNAGTAIYVGKDASVDGTIIIGNSDDYSPGMLQYTDVVEAGELKAGDSLAESGGYSYVLPEDCVKYSYFKTMDYFGDRDAFGASSFDVSATNEYGVSVNSMIVHKPNPKALKADPFLVEGIRQELLPQILVANSKTARDAVELLTGIVDGNGCSAGCVALVSDQKEAWIVELLAGHQYVAQKLADDLVGFFGDEYVLQTINPEEENAIISPDLYKVAEDNGFAVYNENEQLDLIGTYQGDAEDFSHMHTWIGHEILAPSQSVEYSTNLVLPDFYAPDEKVELSDIFALFRNRYEGTQFDPEIDSEYAGMCVSEQINGGVYINQTYCDAPAEIAVVTWATPANAAFSPFLPFAGGADEIPEEFSTNASEDKFDSDVAQMVYARLAATCFQRRLAYGTGVRSMWEFDEACYLADMGENIQKWSELYAASSRRAVKDINKYLEEALDDSIDKCEDMFDSLQWQFVRSGVIGGRYSDEEAVGFGYAYEPVFDVEEYANKAGWETEVKGNVLTAVKGDKKIVFDASSDQSVSFSGFEPEELGELEGVQTLEEEEIVENIIEESEESEESEEDEKVVEVQDVEEAEEVVETEETDEVAIDPEVLKEIEEVIDEADIELSDDVEDVEIEAEESEETDTTEIDAAEEELMNELESMLSDEVSVSDFEVGLLFEVQKFFAGEIDEIPELGLTRADAEKYLNDVAEESVKVVENYFGKNIDEITYYDVIDSDLVADAQASLNEAATEIGKLINTYYDEELVNTVMELGSQVSIEELSDIVSVYANDINGIIRAYMIEVIDPIINTDLSEEEIRDILNELSTNAQALIEEYFGVTIEGIDIDIDLNELGIDLTDEEVVDIMNSLDPAIVDGLSEILGVDVNQAIEDFTIQVEESAAKKKSESEPVEDAKKEPVKVSEIPAEPVTAEATPVVAEAAPVVAETVPEPVAAPIVDMVADVVVESVPIATAACEPEPIVVARVSEVAELDPVLPAEITPEPVAEEEKQEAVDAVLEENTEDSADSESENSIESSLESEEEPDDTITVYGCFDFSVRGGKFYASSSMLKYFK